MGNKKLKQRGAYGRIALVQKDIDRLYSEKRKIKNGMIQMESGQAIIRMAFLDSVIKAKKEKLHKMELEYNTIYMGEYFD